MEKRFVISCKCGWKELTTGISADLKHLKEIPNKCANCGRPRCFFCPLCHSPSKMLRIGARRF